MHPVPFSVRGHLFLRNHGLCLKICFCDLFIYLFFFPQLSVPPTLRTHEEWLSSYRRGLCAREVKTRVSETVYKNGTFIATERSCTWLHRVTTDGNRSWPRPSWVVRLLKEVQDTTCLDTSTNQKYTKNMKKSRHSATRWKQGVTVYLFFLNVFPFFSFFLTDFFKSF